MMKLIRRVFYKLIQHYAIARAKKQSVRGTVLMLHDIGVKGSEFCITPDEFESLASFLSTHHTIRLEDWEKEKDFYALTIDDVPEGFYLYAFPLLKRYQIPFTIFVSLSLLDSEGYITTAQLFEMIKSELCIVGSHGIRHVEYYKLNKHEIVEELKESKRLLAEIVNKPIDLFAFPYGSYYACGLNNFEVVSESYKYGFGTLKSPITSPLVFSKYFLPRINVDATLINLLMQNEKG